MLAIQKSLESSHLASSKDNLLKTSLLFNFDEIESITLQFINTRPLNDDLFFMYNSALVLLTESVPYFITNTKDKDGKIIGSKVILRNQYKDAFIYRLKVEVFPRFPVDTKPEISSNLIASGSGFGSVSSFTLLVNPLFFEEFNELYDLYSSLPFLKISFNGTNFSMIS